MADLEYQGPSWDLSDEYVGVDDPALDDDLDEASAHLDEASYLNTRLAETPSVTLAQALFRRLESAGILIANVSVFGRSILSVDGRHVAARALMGRLESYQKRYTVLSEPLTQYLNGLDEASVETYLSADDIAPSAFQLRHSRSQRHANLDLLTEQRIQRLSQDGLHAWGKLYSQLSSTLQCAVSCEGELKSMSVAEAAGLLSSGVDQQRKDAWVGINAGWKQHDEACAAALNAISGWRLEMAEQRSHTKSVHYLDAGLHSSRIKRETLDALMAVTEAAKPMTQRAASLQARAYGKAGFGPWDLRAPAPVIDPNASLPKIRFDDAMRTIAAAYGEVDSSMAEFVEMMGARRWIEGTVGSAKRPGAYCTGFRKSRTPRVYMTYSGGASNVITLAHELGHAYHSWVMRDLPMSQLNYGMSLAETASTFGETLVRDAMLRQSNSQQEKLNIMWAEMSALTGFMVNIPTRYTFEKSLYEKRKERPLQPGEISDLMSDAWRTWYGDALAEPDPMFWASKLHFYISGITFYNFPYLFGYLFSLGIYAKRDTFGDTFFDRYVALLRDTGRMTAEDLAAEHLDVDLTQPTFWQDTVDRLTLRVDAFEGLLDELSL